MRKFHLLGIMLLAVFAFGAVSAAAASAEETLFLLAEWLWEGNPVSGELLVESLGTLLLEDNNLPLGLGKAMVLCSGTLDGTIGENGLDLISEVLGVSIEALVEPGLACENQENCIEPLVWAAKLPWETQLELHEDEGVSHFVVLILGKPGWHIECMFGGSTDECTAESEGVFEVDNNPGGTPNALFSEAITLLSGLNNGTCTLGEVGSGVVEGEGLISHATGGVISASSV